MGICFPENIHDPNILIYGNIEMMTFFIYQLDNNYNVKENKKKHEM